MIDLASLPHVEADTQQRADVKTEVNADNNGATQVCTIVIAPLMMQGDEIYIWFIRAIRRGHVWQVDSSFREND